MQAANNFNGVLRQISNLASRAFEAMAPRRMQQPARTSVPLFASGHVRPRGKRTTRTAIDPRRLDFHCRSASGQVVSQVSSSAVTACNVIACNAALENFNPFANNEQTCLSRLSAALRSVVATLQLSCFDVELQSYSNVESVARKILPKLQERWSMIAWNMQPDIPH